MNTYSEKDIQDYLDGIFLCDEEAIRVFIEQHPEVKKQVELYRNLYSLLEQQPVADEVSLNLADRVVGVIQARQEQRMAREAKLLNQCLLVIGLITLGIVVWKFGWHQLFFSLEKISVLVVLLLAVILTWVFARVEMEAKHRIFASID